MQLEGAGVQVVFHSTMSRGSLEIRAKVVKVISTFSRFLPKFGKKLTDGKHQPQTLYPQCQWGVWEERWWDCKYGSRNIESNWRIWGTLMSNVQMCETDIKSHCYTVKSAGDCRSSGQGLNLSQWNCTTAVNLKAQAQCSVSEGHTMAVKCDFPCPRHLHGALLY